MKKPYIIGIAGGSGAGKTFTLTSLRDHFSEEMVCIVSQDNYYRPVAEQARDEQGFINFDRPEGIDDGKFLKDITALANNQAVSLREYRFNRPGVSGRVILLRPAPVIIIEDIFIFHFPGIKKMLDLQVFIDSDAQTRLARRLMRDKEERGVDEETIQYQWQNHVAPAYKSYLLPYRAEADLIFDNGHSPDIEIAELIKIIVHKTGIGAAFPQ